MLLPKDALRADAAARRRPGGHRPQRRLGHPAVGRAGRPLVAAAATAAAGIDPGLLPAVLPGHDRRRDGGAARSARCRWSSAAPTPRSPCWPPAPARALQVNLGSGAQLLRPAGPPGAGRRPGRALLRRRRRTAGTRWRRCRTPARPGRGCSRCSGWTGPALAGSLPASPAGAGGVRVPPVPDRRARRGGRTRRPRRLDRAVGGHHPRRPRPGGAWRGWPARSPPPLDLLGPARGDRWCSPAAARGTPGVQQLLADVAGPAGAARPGAQRVGGRRRGARRPRGRAWTCVPQRAPEPVVEPRQRRGLAAVRERWAAASLTPPRGTVGQLAPLYQTSGARRGLPAADGGGAPWRRCSTRSCSSPTARRASR